MIKPFLAISGAVILSVLAFSDAQAQMQQTPNASSGQWGTTQQDASGFRTTQVREQIPPGGERRYRINEQNDLIIRQVQVPGPTVERRSAVRGFW